MNLFAALAASVSFLCTAASAREYPTDPNRYRVLDPSWTVCEFDFYAPQASGDPHAGQTALQLWTEPFKASDKLRFEIYRYSPGYNMMTGELADEYLQFLSRHLGRTEEYLNPRECHFYRTKEEAAAAIPAMMRATPRDASTVPAPSKAMLDRAVRALTIASGGSDEEKVAPEKDMSAPSSKPQPEKTLAPKGPTPSELAAERRRAADERFEKARKEYEAKLAEQKRQVEEFERAQAEVARKKEEQQIAAQRALDSFRAEQAAHAEKLRQHQLALEEHQRALAAGQQGTAAAGKRGRFQATSAIVDTREAAMAGLMRQTLPGPLTDVQCSEVKMYSPPKWTCWGFYEADVRTGTGSAQ